MLVSLGPQPADKGVHLAFTGIGTMVGGNNYDLPTPTPSMAQADLQRHPGACWWESKSARDEPARGHSSAMQTVFAPSLTVVASGIDKVCPMNLMMALLLGPKGEAHCGLGYQERPCFCDEKRVIFV